MKNKVYPLMLAAVLALASLHGAFASRCAASGIDSAAGAYKFSKYVGSGCLIHAFK